MQCPHCKKRILNKELSPEVFVRRNTFKTKLEKVSKTWNKHVNVFIGKRMTKVDEELFFGREKNRDDGSITVHYKEDVWLTTVMRDLGFFKSIAEAKGAGWHTKADMGFDDRVVTIKGRPHRLCILKRLDD